MLILGRTPWHMTWEACDRSTPASGSTRRACQLEVFASRAILVLPKTSPTPRLPAVLTRVSSFEPRPVGTVPECVPLPRHTLDEDSPANGNVSRAGDCCGEGGLGSSRRWHDHRPASRTGQGGSCSSSARKSRSLPLPRPEQLRVEGSPFRVESGRPLPCLKGRRRCFFSAALGGCE